MDKILRGVVQLLELSKQGGVHTCENITFPQLHMQTVKISLFLDSTLTVTTKTIHPAGTSTDSDKCDLSKDSDMAPLTLGSMENTTYFISHRKPI